MSEADRLTSLPFPKEIHCVNSTLDSPAKCFHSNFVEEQYYQTDCSGTIPLNVSVYSAEDPESVRWSAFSNCVESENGTASLTPAEVATLVDLIQEMRLSNNNLLERVIHLEQELAECQDGLQSYRQRARVAEKMLAQKTPDLISAQEQVRFLSQELQTAHHTTQQQQTLIDNLTTQLAGSQERMSQMEQECALTQANYNEKFHQQIQTENSCRELRTRLIRQQRYTMQLKFALEKSLEAPNRSSYQFLDDEYSACSSYEQKVDSQQAQPLFPKTPPITPWSAQVPSCMCDLESTRAEFLGSSQHSADWQVHQTQPSCFAQDIGRTDESGWQNLFSMNWYEAEAEEEIAEATEEDLLATHFGFDLDIPAQDQSLSNHTNQFPASEPLTNTKASIADTNWPSPVVYPGQPPKGRKSLSAIELPTFTKK